MPQETLLITKAELTAFVAAIFEAVGLSKEHAGEWAKMLVWANLRGTDSHGIIRIPRYIDLVKAKSINAAPNIRVERKPGSAAVVLEADRAPSAVALTRAVAEAVTVARDVGVGWCAARHLTHTGAIGYFALQAAEAGFAGVVMSASGPMMIYPGSRVAAVSSNPIAFAIPRKGGQPYLLDFSTGVVANGKIMGAADRGEAIPTGWGVDKDGRDTTDPKKVENVLPMAGIKGAGLSFMIECLTSLLVSEPRIAPDLESWAIGDDPFLNGSVIAIDPGAFGDRDRWPCPRRRREKNHAARRTRRRDPRRARGHGHSHPQGYMATYRQGRRGGGCHAADVSGGEGVNFEGGMSLRCLEALRWASRFLRARSNRRCHWSASSTARRRDRSPG